MRDDPRQGGGTGVVRGSAPGGRTEPVRHNAGRTNCIPLSASHGCNLLEVAQRVGSNTPYLR